MLVRKQRDYFIKNQNMIERGEVNANGKEKLRVFCKKSKERYWVKFKTGNPYMVLIPEVIIQKIQILILWF